MATGVVVASCLLLLETNGNQQFIFDSNRQREQVGASRILKQLPRWVRDAVDGASEVEWVLSTSGKVIVRMPSAQQARRLVTDVTARAASEAPGLSVSGAWIELASDVIDQVALNDVHACVAAHNARQSASGIRFAQRPFVVPCAESGLPASAPLGVTGEQPRDAAASLSEVSRVKRLQAPSARQDLLDILDTHNVTDAAVLVPHLAKLEELMGSEDPSDDADDEAPTRALPWVGVVHIDGNGIGAAFRDLTVPEGRDLPSYLLEISTELEIVTEDSFALAAREVLDAARAEAESTGRPMPAVVPVVPVLLGADDVTVICDGRYALIFAEAFVRAFETRTEASDVLRGLARDGRSGLTAGAGVAIVKAKFPFFRAYELAESLCSSAKARSRERSVIDFHLLYDSVDADLHRIRPQYQDQTLRPVLLTGAAPGDADTWSTLLARAARLSGADGSPGVPRHQSVRLRPLLRDDLERANLLWTRVVGHSEYGAAASAVTGGADGALLWADGAGGTEGALLDCLELAEILPPSYLARFAEIPIPDTSDRAAHAHEKKQGESAQAPAAPPAPPAAGGAEGGAARPLVPGEARGMRVQVLTDWSVGQGAGVPGGVDSIVRLDARRRPYVTGTQMTGLVADAARQVARALDEGADRGWEPWVRGLFGAPGVPALVAVGPATSARPIGMLNQPGVAIDPSTGAAAPDQLRLVERAAPATLRGDVRLLDRTSTGQPVAWTDEQRRAASAVIGAAVALVDGVGGDRRRGSGSATCSVDQLPVDGPGLRALAASGPPRLPIASPLPAARVKTRAADETSSMVQVVFRFALQQPLRASAGVRSNVLLTHDRIPGTTVFAWLHRSLQRMAPGSNVVRDAPTSGGLLAADAVVAGRAGDPGRPVPFSFLKDKISGLGAPIVNRLVAPEPTGAHRPLRAGYLRQSASGWGFAELATVRAMHTAIDPSTGASLRGGLYTIEAIPAETVLAAEVRLSADVIAALPSDWMERIGGEHRLGGKARTEYGLTHVTVDAPTPVVANEVVPTGDGELLLWLWSDAILRGADHAPGGIVELVQWLRGAGIGVGPPPETSPGAPYAAAARSRRIDGWNASAGAPQPTRVALRAGTVLRLPWDGTGAARLAALTISGIGERQAEGFGRIACQHPLLADPAPDVKAAP